MLCSILKLSNLTSCDDLSLQQLFAPTIFGAALLTSVVYFTECGRKIVDEIELLFQKYRNSVPTNAIEEIASNTTDETYLYVYKELYSDFGGRPFQINPDKSKSQCLLVKCGNTWLVRFQSADESAGPCMNCKTNKLYGNEDRFTVNAKIEQSSLLALKGTRKMSENNLTCVPFEELIDTIVWIESRNGKSRSEEISNKTVILDVVSIKSTDKTNQEFAKKQLRSSNLNQITDSSGNVNIRKANYTFDASTQTPESVKVNEQTSTNYTNKINKGTDTGSVDSFGSPIASSSLTEEGMKQLKCKDPQVTEGAFGTPRACQSLNESRTKRLKWYVAEVPPESSEAPLTEGTTKKPNVNFANASDESFGPPLASSSINESAVKIKCGKTQEDLGTKTDSSKHVKVNRKESISTKRKMSTCGKSSPSVNSKKSEETESDTSPLIFRKKETIKEVPITERSSERTEDPLANLQHDHSVSKLVATKGGKGEIRALEQEVEDQILEDQIPVVPQSEVTPSVVPSEKRNQSETAYETALDFLVTSLDSSPKQQVVAKQRKGCASKICNENYINCEIKCGKLSEGNQNLTTSNKKLQKKCKSVDKSLHPIPEQHLMEQPPVSREDKLEKFSTFHESMEYVSAISVTGDNNRNREGTAADSSLPEFGRNNPNLSRTKKSLKSSYSSKRKLVKNPINGEEKVVISGSIRRTSFEEEVDKFIAQEKMRKMQASAISQAKEISNFDGQESNPFFNEQNDTALYTGSLNADNHKTRSGRNSRPQGVETVDVPLVKTTKVDKSSSYQNVSTNAVSSNDDRLSQNSSIFSEILRSYFEISVLSDKLNKYPLDISDISDDERNHNITRANTFKQQVTKRSDISTSTSEIELIDGVRAPEGAESPRLFRRPLMQIFDKEKNCSFDTSQIFDEEIDQIASEHKWQEINTQGANKYEDFSPKIQDAALEQEISDPLDIWESSNMQKRKSTTRHTVVNTSSDNPKREEKYVEEIAYSPTGVRRRTVGISTEVIDLPSPRTNDISEEAITEVHNRDVFVREEHVQVQQASDISDTIAKLKRRQQEIDETFKHSSGNESNRYEKSHCFTRQDEWNESQGRNKSGGEGRKHRSATDVSRNDIVHRIPKHEYLENRSSNRKLSDSNSDVALDIFPHKQDPHNATSEGSDHKGRSTYTWTTKSPEKKVYYNNNVTERRNGRTEKGCGRGVLKQRLHSPEKVYTNGRTLKRSNDVRRLDISKRSNDTDLPTEPEQGVLERSEKYIREIKKISKNMANINSTRDEPCKENDILLEINEMFADISQDVYVPQVENLSKISSDESGYTLEEKSKDYWKTFASPRHGVLSKTKNITVYRAGIPSKDTNYEASFYQEAESDQYDTAEDYSESSADGRNANRHQRNLSTINASYIPRSVLENPGYATLVAEKLNVVNCKHANRARTLSEAGMHEINNLSVQNRSYPSVSNKEPTTLDGSRKSKDKKQKCGSKTCTSERKQSWVTNVEEVKMSLASLKQEISKLDKIVMQSVPQKRRATRQIRSASEGFPSRARQRSNHPVLSQDYPRNTAPLMIPENYTPNTLSEIYRIRAWSS